ARGVMPTGLLLASALWCRYCAGTDAEGEAIAPNDPDWDLLTATARAAKQEPARWIGMRAIYGELAGDPALVAAFAAALDCVWKDGVRGAMARYIDGAPMGNAALPPR